MSAPGRLLPRLRPTVTARTIAPRVAYASTIQSQTPPSPLEPSQKQSMPIGGFYQAMIDVPLPGPKPEEPPSTSVHKKKETASAAPTETPTAQPQEEPPAPNPPPASGAEKAAIVFGSALAGPQARLERLAASRPKGTRIAGVLVPPRPEEPDTCCMSGCVNCVWEQFREDMEEWSAANSEAESRLKEQEALKDREDDDVEPISVSSVSVDDGGGSETNRTPETPKAGGAKNKNLWDDDLYSDIPVGIREFMKTEKKLKQAHAQEGTVGG